MRRMDLGLVIATVIALALLLATVAGFLAARMLTHAAETSSPQRSDAHDR